MSNSKKAVPRHRTQSKHSSNRQERAIEKKQRQKAKKEMRIEDGRMKRYMNTLWRETKRD